MKAIAAILGAIAGVVVYKSISRTASGTQSSKDQPLGVGGQSAVRSPDSPPSGKTVSPFDGKRRRDVAAVQSPRSVTEPAVVNTDQTNAAGDVASVPTPQEETFPTPLEKQRVDPNP